MFIREIQIKGYQSLYDVQLKLGALTVIHGETDTGKSSFYRAIRALITTEAGDAFISKGKSGVEVALILTSGEKILWKKQREKSAIYSMGEAVWRRAKSLPEELDNKLKIRMLSVNGEKFYPNLRGQFDRLFLLFESSGKRARILGALISNILLKGIRSANIERNRNEADIRALDDLVAEIEKSKEVDWKKLLNQMKESYKALKRVEKGLELHGRLQELLNKQTELKRLEKVSVKFLSDDFFEKMVALLERYDSLASLSEEYSTVKAYLHSAQETEEASLSLLENKKEELKGTKEKLIFKCPHCNKAINMLEIKELEEG